MRFKIGFTGTQEGMTDQQKEDFLAAILSRMERNSHRGVEFHQGQCIGADHEALLLVKGLGGVWTVSHPPISKLRVHNEECDEVRPEDGYLERNHQIVDEVDVLLAAPRSRDEELRSGTWATVRYARRMSKPIEMIWP